MSKPFVPTPHPTLGLPTAAQALALGAQGWAQLMLEREQRIRDERAKPFPHWFEPPIWSVADCLLGFPWVPEDQAKAMRAHLGFDQPVKVLLINGGNRGGKSEYASDRVMRVLRLLNGYRTDRSVPARAWCLHSTLQMSRDYQMPLLHQYLPPELKGRDIKTAITYITYKQKTGFSEEKFVLPDGADCLFKAYEQDRRSIEGGNLDIVWPDELVPSDWIETLELRIAERGGWMIITFTPVEGYTETVRLFQDGAQVVKESTAFLLPTDGGPPDEARALGLLPEELAELKAAALANRAASFPQSRPENCQLWLEGKSGQPDIPTGRTFEKVPRVLKCVSQNSDQPRACIFFHTADNPYGNPKSVYAMIAGKHRDFKLERFYGVATKNISARFPKFNMAVHVVKPEAIPIEGTNYHYVDPAGRNFFQHWYRRTPNRIYLYREWPGDYSIPGVGLPGPWALPDGRHPDGRRGPAQKAFGWGHLAYKMEIARLEGWKKYRETKPAGLSEEDWLAERSAWDSAEDGAAEVITTRYIDSRFASTPKLERDRPVTLLEEFADLNLFFEPTPGDDIEEGVQLLQDLLDYNPEQPVDFFNCPQLLISAACVNTIYSLSTWTGYTREGRRCLDGASKDPVDLLRYFALSEAPYLGGKDEEPDEPESEFTPSPKHYY